MVDRGGKGWRSSWLVLCCHALGYRGSDQRLRELMPVVELIHTGSLIIDDIQDESATRRGLPALHAQIGADLAINAGNFLYFLPMLLIQELSWLTDEQRLETYHRIAVGMRQGHLGQALDLMWSKGRYDVAAKVEQFEQTRDELLEQYRLKCGCQLEAAAHIAGSLSEAPQRYVEALSSYSQSFGVVYQLVDDVNDAGGESQDFGKSTGEDLRNGRLNIVLLHALAAASPQRRQPLLDALANGTGAEHAAGVQNLIAETGALESSLELASDISSAARSCLERIPPSDARIVLECVPKSLLKQARERLERHVR
jgi:geranylgeranyl diphosphate synthase type I